QWVITADPSRGQAHTCSREKVARASSSGTGLREWGAVGVLFELDQVSEKSCRDQEDELGLRVVAHELEHLCLELRAVGRLMRDEQDTRHDIHDAPGPAGRRAQFGLCRRKFGDPCMAASTPRSGIASA